jgi:ParB-like chromosome segregation protein Spo0J
MAQIRQIPIEEIDPSPWQPRTKFDDIDSLAKSILEVGLIQPVTVRPCNGRFELVAGERRWRAVRLANLPDITCIVRELSDSESRRIALAENVARKDLTSIEEAAAWAEHFDAEMWQDEAYRDYAEMNGLTSEFDRMQARQRARWLLTKMASDRRNQTDYFTNKFVGKAEAIFSNHPRRIEWETFLNHDIPLLELPQIEQESSKSIRQTSKR